MNLTDSAYSSFSLVREMMETSQVVSRFDVSSLADMAGAVRAGKKVVFTGEGSSRIFPAKNAMCKNLRAGGPLAIAADGARQAAEYTLDDFVVFGASNSGKTKEVVSLFGDLKSKGHRGLYGLTANEGTPLGDLCTQCVVLGCGKEEAVAATKSVIEQALCYQTIIGEAIGDSGELGRLGELSGAIEQALTMKIDPAITKALANAGHIMFAGRNDGVAEELTLKTNEIVRKRSDYLEGTYAVHGIEEVLDNKDVVIVIEPFAEELDKFKEVLVDGVGLTMVVMSTQQTSFPTVQLPSVAGLDTHIQLAAGWNLLVEAGVALGINLDKPERARKVGNELIV